MPRAVLDRKAKQMRSAVPHDSLPRRPVLMRSQAPFRACHSIYISQVTCMQDAVPERAAGTTFRMYCPSRQDLADVRARQLGAAARACPDIAVRHLPLHACALDSGAFVLPAAGGAAAHARLHGGVAGYGWPQVPAAGDQDTRAGKQLVDIRPRGAWPVLTGRMQVAATDC